jgi:hypothetical protein
VRPGLAAEGWISLKSDFLSILFSQVLYIGADNYPFPIPLAQDGSSRWRFDATAGDEELRARRIGSNELTAMDAARVIANAEELYQQSTLR